MSQPQGVAQLVQGDPPQVLGVVRLTVQAWWQVGADQDVGAAVGATDGVAAEHDPAGGGHVVDDDVGILAPVHPGQGDQPVEALLQDSGPGGDRRSVASTAPTRTESILRTSMGVHPFASFALFLEERPGQRGRYGGV
jgi:hypothetical protein